MENTNIIVTIILSTLTIIGTIVGGFRWLYKKGKEVGAKEQRFTNVEEKVKNLPCEHHKQKITSFDNLSDTIKELSSVTNIISAWITKKDTQMIEPLFKKSSPYKLTPFGRDLLNISKAKQTIDNNLDFFIFKIDELQPKVALDVENGAVDVLIKNLGDEKFNDIKNFVYNSPDKIELTNPENENDKVTAIIDLSTVLRTMGIYLRDKYLDKNPQMLQGL